MRFAVAMHEQRIVSNRFFDELLEQEQFRAVDDCVDAELERLHRRESLERVAEQQYGGVTPLAHRHFSQRLQGQILCHAIGREAFLQDNDLIANLAEANEEVAVRGSGVDLVAQFSQSRPGGVEPFRG